MEYVYLDNAATTPVDLRVIEVINTHLKETYGNASSLHSIGEKANRVLEESRIIISDLINAEKDDIIFTSSGTESDNMAIKGVARANKKRGNHIITSSIEHHAIENPCKELENQGFKLTYLPVDDFGFIDLEDLKEKITDNTILISIMFANNEIGTIEPIKAIGEIAKDHNILFHTDAVQAFGKLQIDVNDLKIDLLSASAHKLYGPKGVGLLYLRNKGMKKGIGKYCRPLMLGGGHEKGMRPSTENVPGIAGFAKAVDIARKEMTQEIKRLTKIRDYMINQIINNVDDCYLNGHPRKRLPGNINLVFKYIEGESLVLSLDMEGIGASTGSACSSQSLEPSHVLIAIGLKPEEAHGSLRLTLGRFNDKSDANFLLEKLPPIVKRLRDISPLKGENMD